MGRWTGWVVYGGLFGILGLVVLASLDGVMLSNPRQFSPRFALVILLILIALLAIVATRSRK